jgi:hypothetical protein
MSDLYNILMGSDPEAGASAQALAQAIRGNRQLAAANALGAGGLGGLAAAQSAEAKQDADLSEKALTARAHYTPQRQEEAALQEPAVAQYLTQALGKLGMPPPDGASARGLRMMLPTALSLHNNEANNASKQLALAQAAAIRGGLQDQTDEKAKQIGDAIMAGHQQPDMKGLFRYGGPVRAYLAGQGYDLGMATNEWNAMQSYSRAANSPSQVRMAQAVSMIPQQVQKIKDLYAKWVELAPVSGIKQFNKASLFAAKQTGGEAGSLANALDAQIADLTSELGFIYTGGNAPTDHAFKLAANNLASNWDEKSFTLAIKNIEDGARYRKNAMGSTGPMGMPGGNRYSGNSAPQQGAPAPAAPPAAPAGGTVNMRRSDGKVGPVPADKVEAARAAGYQVVP